MEANKQSVRTRNIVKKITVKIINGGEKPSVFKLAEFLAANPGLTVMPLATVVGRASAFETGESDFGSFVKLIGSFEAINANTGEVTVSGVCILPGSANDLVYGSLRAVMETGGSIEFAFRIGLKRDETSATGYVYNVEQVMAPNAADPLANLKVLAGMPVNGNLLEAPQTDPAPASTVQNAPQTDPEPDPEPAKGARRGR